MINYTEKGAGLHEKIRASGHWLREENGEWVSSDDAAVQSVIDAYTLDEAKSYRCAQIEVQAKILRDKAIKSVSPGEMASWPIKLAEANAFASGGATPMLSLEASARGITVADLVAKVEGNAAVFSALEASTSGICGMHRDAVKALTDFDAVVTYDSSTGWPVI